MEKNKDNEKIIEEKNTIKKTILPRTAVKGLINGFVAYGILLIFVFLSLIIFVTWIVENNKEFIDYNILKYSLPLLSAFIIFFVIKAICRLSTYDLFKNCKIEESDIENVCTKMNLFYICLVVFSILAIIIYLLTRFNNEKIQINRDVMIYSQVSSAYAEEKEVELLEEYEQNKSNILVQTIIVEMGLLLGIFSLIPTQRRLIKLYN